MLVEVQIAPDFNFDRIDKPQATGTLFLFLPIQWLKQYLILFVLPGDSKKGLAVNMCQPDSLPKQIASLLLSNLIIGKQH